ncbi:MAG TPA: hypothetical protein VNE16_08180 [Vicinamibacterales bacterium]|nr:hypothetical protein [Vicinamibacterales bacterium]
MRQRVAIFILCALWTPAGLARAQARGQNAAALANGPVAAAAASAGSSSGASSPSASGYALPDSRRLHIRVSFLAGYGVDEAQNSQLGFEGQGGVGWAIVDLFGAMTDHLSYRLEVNPVNDTAPLPGCGQPGYFYPNSPQNLGPVVRCTSDGLRRVDDYKFTALDPLVQQGPIRQAYVNYQRGAFGLRFGRFILPLGFNWQKAGSFTAKDATHIQRIDAEASFGAQLSLQHQRADGTPLAAVHLAAVAGSGNRYHDYDYYYFVNASAHTNSSLTALVSGTVFPVRALEVRAAYQYGYTGSKVESVPNYFADKHNDKALVLSARYRPIPHASVFGEYAHYVWGPTPTSAALLGVDPAPINKNGYYVGGEGSYPVTGDLKLGVVVTREELSRDDSLVKYLASRNLYGVSMGKKERDTIIRAYATFGRYLTVALYRTWLDNPFPWLSGIAPVTGPGQYQSRGSNRWGLVVLMQFPS